DVLVLRLLLLFRGRLEHGGARRLRRGNDGRDQRGQGHAAPRPAERPALVEGRVVATKLGGQWLCSAHGLPPQDAITIRPEHQSTLKRGQITRRAQAKRASRDRRSSGTPLRSRSRVPCETLP